MLPVETALAQDRPSFGVIIIWVRGIHRRRRDPVLQRAEIREEVCDPRSPLVVYYVGSLSFRSDEGEKSKSETYTRLPSRNQKQVK